MKICSRCKKSKPLSEYNKSSKTLDKLERRCRDCAKKERINYYRAKNGLLSKIYNAQIRQSKIRGHKPPNYTKNQLKKWLFEHADFETLYTNWIKSGYDSLLKPSVDRIENHMPYSFENIQLGTWHQNILNLHKDRVKGKYITKQNVPVVQLDLNGNIIKHYFSVGQASRETKATKTAILLVCKEKPSYITAGGFKWKFPSI